MFCPVIVIVISMLSGEMTPFETSPPYKTSPPSEQIPNQGEMKNMERVLTYARYTIQNERRNIKIKSHGFLNKLEWFQNELQIVIRQQEQIMKEDFYRGVNDCGISTCGNLTSAPTPEKEILQIFQTYPKVESKRKYLKGKVKKSLSNFHRDVQFYEKNLKYLISIEELSRFKDLNTTTRTALLNKLQKHLVYLRFYPEIVGILKRSNKGRKEGESVNLKEPDCLSSLLINEWRVLSNSKKYLEIYDRNIAKVIKLLRKIKNLPKKGNKKRKKIF